MQASNSERGKEEVQKEGVLLKKKLGEKERQNKAASPEIRRRGGPEGA